MTRMFMFTGLALFPAAALGWNAGTTDAVDHPEVARPQRRPRFSGATIAARIGALLAALSYPTEDSVLSGVTMAGPMNMLLLEAAAPAPILDLGTPATPEHVVPAPAAGQSTWIAGANTKLDLNWVWPAN